MEFSTCVLGIELGSTRIKAVLIDENHLPIASGSYTWENDLVDGVWTYPLEKAVEGVRACYSQLRQEFESKYGPLTVCENHDPTDWHWIDRPWPWEREANA